MKFLKKKKTKKLRIPVLSLIITGVLLIIITVLAFINYQKYDASISEYISGTITELIGIIITVIFVQVLFDKKSEKEESSDERSDIKRMHNVLNLYINKYIMYFNCVASTLENRNKSNVFKTGNFSIKDICDLHKASLLTNEGMLTPSIDGFCEIEHKIREYIITIIERIDFKYYSKIGDILMGYIHTSMQYDSSGQLLNAKNMTSGGKPEIERASKMILEHGEDFFQEFLKGNRQTANMMHPYVFLFLMMQTEREILLRYLDEAQKI
ncbi:hypothetical protein FACS189479_01110 [Spirochaetia bacterium]|nr:hypothetical protein FACS189479_01110 [Spirochaetia bacterium]